MPSSAHLTRGSQSTTPRLPGSRVGLAKDDVSGVGCPRGEDGAVNRNPLPPKAGLTSWICSLNTSLLNHPALTLPYLPSSRGISAVPQPRLFTHQGISLVPVRRTMPELPFLTTSLPSLLRRERAGCSLRNAGGNSHLMS